MKRLTTYKRPSLADQISSGIFTKVQAAEILGKLIRDGAASTTIKKVRRAIVSFFELS